MSYRRRRGQWLTAAVVALGLAGTLVLVAAALRTPPAPAPVTDGRTRGVDEGPRSPELRDYVALGDSYAAGPRNPDLPGARVFPYAVACARSTSNYPQLVAVAMDLRLVDRTCSGASATDVLRGQSTTSGVEVPPQVEALQRDTDLVTVSIGANEYDLAGRIVGQCLEAARSSTRGSPCTDAVGDRGVRDLDEAAQGVEDAVVAVLEEVRSRAPRARVLVVGYANYFPADQSCPERTRLARGDFPFLRRAYGLLTRAARSAASRAGVEYVDPDSAFDGHLLCSGEPYVRGYAEDNLEAFHLSPAGERTLADLVVAQLGEPPQ